MRCFQLEPRVTAGLGLVAELAVVAHAADVRQQPLRFPFNIEVAIKVRPAPGAAIAALR